MRGLFNSSRRTQVGSLLSLFGSWSRSLRDIATVFVYISTITSWGPDTADTEGSADSGETAAFDNMLTKFPTGLVAVVSDSYNIWAALKNLWGSRLKEKILARDGTLVIRPGKYFLSSRFSMGRPSFLNAPLKYCLDSGDPPEVVVKCLEILGTKFGTKLNSKGYKLLPEKVRLIQVGFDQIYQSDDSFLLRIFVFSLY